MGYAEDIKFPPGIVRGKRERKKICPKCKKNLKYGMCSYCLPCHLAYMKERRKNNPELKRQATEYKREYRRLKRLEKKKKK